MSLASCQNALKRISNVLPGACVPPSGRPESSSFTATLHLPWCGRQLHWQVVFSTLPPYIAPDFIFSSDDESFSPLCGSLEPEQHAMLASLLLAWGPTSISKPKDIPALFGKIVTIMLSGYNSHQLSGMKHIQNDRLQFELSTLPHLIVAKPDSAPLLDLSEPSEQDSLDLTTTIQALLVQGKACLSLPLAGLDVSKLATVTWGFDGHVLEGVLQAPTEQQLREQELKLMREFRLAVDFPLANDTRSTPDVSLQVPAALQAAACWPQPTMPAWEPHSCLMEVLPQVVARVQPVLDTWATQLLTRQALLESLSGQLGMAPVELNLQTGSGQWAIMWDACPVLVTVACSAPASHKNTGGLPPPTTTTSTVASTAFPEEKPLVTLTNLRMMLMQPGAPAISKWFRDYPWSPRWQPPEMAARIIAFIKGELPALLSQGPNAIPIYIPPGAAPPAITTPELRNY